MATKKVRLDTFYFDELALIGLGRGKRAKVADLRDWLSDAVRCELDRLVGIGQSYIDAQKIRRLEDLEQQAAALRAEVEAGKTDGGA